MQGDGAGAGGVQGEWFPVIVNNDPFSFLLSAAEKVTSADWLPGLVFGCWAAIWLAIVIVALVRSKPVRTVQQWWRALDVWLRRQWQ